MADIVLTDEDRAKLEDWIASLNKRRPKNPTGMAYLDFHFSNASGIGMSVTVTDRITGKTLDLTDHANW